MKLSARPDPETSGGRPLRADNQVPVVVQLLKCRSLLSGLRDQLQELPPVKDHLGYVLAMVNLLSDALDTYEEGSGRHLDNLSVEETISLQIDHLNQGQTIVFPPSRFTPDEVMQFLGFARKSGTLRAVLPEETIEFDLDEGDVVDARSDRAPPGLRLGEILVARGELTETALQSYLDRARTSSKRIGRGLLSVGLIGRGALVEALRVQLLHHMQRVMQVEKVAMDFRPRENPYGRCDYRLPLMEVLLNAVAMEEGKT